MSGNSNQLPVHAGSSWEASSTRASVAQILCETLHKIFRHRHIKHHLLVLVLLAAAAHKERMMS